MERNKETEKEKSGDVSPSLSSFVACIHTYIIVSSKEEVFVSIRVPMRSFSSFLTWRCSMSLVVFSILIYYTDTHDFPHTFLFFHSNLPAQTRIQYTQYDIHQKRLFVAPPVNTLIFTVLSFPRSSPSHTPYFFMVASHCSISCPSTSLPPLSLTQATLNPPAHCTLHLPRSTPPSPSPHAYTPRHLHDPGSYCLHPSITASYTDR